MKSSNIQAVDMWLSWLTGMALIFLVSIHPPLFAGYPDRNSGQIVVYLERMEQHEIHAELIFDEIFLQGSQGEIRIPPSSRSFETDDLRSQQLLLAETLVDPGNYRGLVLKGRISTVSPDSPHRLRLPSDFTANIPLELQIKAGRAETVFLKLNVVTTPDTSEPAVIVFHEIRKNPPPELSLAYISNQDSDNLTVIDRVKGEVVSSIRVGESPRGLAIARTSGLLFAANSGENTISIIDIRTQQPREVINLDFGDEPEALCISPDERYLYVANRGSDRVTIIDLLSFQPIANVTSGTEPVDIAVDPWNGYVYVVNSMSDNLTVFDPRNITDLYTISVGSVPMAIDFSANERRAFVANFRSGYVSIINSQDLAVSDRIHLTRAFSDVIIDTFSDILLCINQNLDYISVVKPDLGIELGDIIVGRLPHKAMLDPENAFLYVVCRNSNNVYVIGENSMNVERIIAAGKNPYMIAFP